MKTATCPRACIVVAALLTGGCATAPRSADGAPPADAAASGDPFAAVLAQANLPPGVPGQTRESLEADIAARGGEVVARHADRLVARGRSSAGIAVDVEYPLRDGRVVARGTGASGTDRPR